MTFLSDSLFVVFTVNIYITRTIFAVYINVKKHELYGSLDHEWSFVLTGKVKCICDR